jgi:hypothetical protein
MRTVELMVSVLLLSGDEAVVHNIVCVSVHGLICGRIRAHYCLQFHISPGSNVSVLSTARTEVFHVWNQRFRGYVPVAAVACRVRGKHEQQGRRRSF